MLIWCRRHARLVRAILLLLVVVPAPALLGILTSPWLDGPFDDQPFIIAFVGTGFAIFVVLEISDRLGLPPRGWGAPAPAFLLASVFALGAAVELLYVIAGLCGFWVQIDWHDAALRLVFCWVPFSLAWVAYRRSLRAEEQLIRRVGPVGGANAEPRDQTTR